MAIINTFEKCLESPYLVVDPDASSRVSALVEQARSRIALAEQIASKSGSADSVEVSNLSHEAMFCSLRALVYAKGYRELGLKCLLLALFSLYIKPGLLDNSVIEAFEAARSLKGAPADHLQAAKSLLETVGPLVAS